MSDQGQEHTPEQQQGRRVDLGAVAQGAGWVPSNPQAPLSYGAEDGPKVLPVQDGLLRRITAEEWASGAFWVAVASSNVSAIAYEEETHTLFVEFQHSSVWKYVGVPYFVATDMYRCTSMGKFVHQRLKNQFHGTQVR